MGEQHWGAYFGVTIETNHSDGTGETLDGTPLYLY